mgnify:FL=1|jgi:hypothetical protein
MSAPRREYDPARRPNIFYKNDPASNEELSNRAHARGQAYSSNNSISDAVSDRLGYDMATGDNDGPTISKKGTHLKNVSLIEGGKKLKDAAMVSGATMSNVSISGTVLGKTKGMMQGKG